jgi:signal transduction histidine kinase
MNILTNKDIRRLLWGVSAIIILFLIFSLIFSQGIVRDFKVRMLNHDYGVAGYLLEHGTSPSDVSAAFTNGKTEEEIFTGKNLLVALGYKADMNNQLLPDIDMLLFRYRLISTLAVIIFGAFIIAIFFIYFKRQQDMIEKANFVINNFMDGDSTVRIDDNEEGSLYKLFTSINSMATSLNAHVEKEKHIKEFLKDTIADISHQLKTPLAALRMYNEIIQDESGNEETVKKFTSKTENSLERMEILIQNLLKITRLDAGTILLNKREENISDIVQEAISSFETRTQQEQKNIVINGSDDVILYCDKDWMIEAIGNLIKNALDHMEAGERIEIEWKETPVVTKLIIKDNGNGIHPEDIHHIFKRFYRSRFSQDTQGIGLGLSLVKSIVEAHNGTITVESTLGKESIFTLDFLKLTNM